MRALQFVSRPPPVLPQGLLGNRLRKFAYTPEGESMPYSRAGEYPRPETENGTLPDAGIAPWVLAVLSAVAQHFSPLPDAVWICCGAHTCFGACRESPPLRCRPANSPYAIDHMRPIAMATGPLAAEACQHVRRDRLSTCTTISAWNGVQATAGPGIAAMPKPGGGCPRACFAMKNAAAWNAIQPVSMAHK